MTTLVTCLGKGTSASEYISKLIESEPWEAVFLICAKGSEEIKSQAAIRVINVDEQNHLLEEMTEMIKEQLNNKIPDTQVALNMVSGSGKMHMATLSAILRCGLGVRLVALTPEGMKEV